VHIVVINFVILSWSTILARSAATVLALRKAQMSNTKVECSGEKLTCDKKLDNFKTHFRVIYNAQFLHNSLAIGTLKHNL
jgi:hypothetical protein